MGYTLGVTPWGHKDTPVDGSRGGPGRNRGASAPARKEVILCGVVKVLGGSRANGSRRALACFGSR